MIRKIPPNPEFFNRGLTTIARKPSETQEEFDSTKDQATFQHDGKEYTLQLDGKTDDVVLSTLKGNPEFWLTDLKQLNGRSDAILKACDATEDWGRDLSASEVDLGTGGSWFASPDFNNKHEVVGHSLYRLGGGEDHSITVRRDEDGITFDVKTASPDGLLKHSMSGLLQSDGSVQPYREGVLWQGPSEGFSYL